MIRVIVTGSRHRRCDELAARIVERLKARHGDALVIVHGGAPGVDSAFDLAAIRLNVRRELHPADWRRHGDAAGPIRNQAMVDKGASLCLAFHPDLAGSRGTRDCVRRAIGPASRSGSSRMAGASLDASGS